MTFYNVVLTTLYYFLDKQISNICHNKDTNNCKNYENNL